MNQLLLSELEMIDCIPRDGEWTEENLLLMNYAQKATLNRLVIERKLPEHFWVRFFYDCNVNPFLLFKYQDLSEEFIEIASKRLSLVNEPLFWNAVSKYKTLSIEFAKKFEFNLNWFLIAQQVELSEEFLEAFYRELSNYELLINCNLPESFIRKHIKDFCLFTLAQTQKLSESFMRDYRKEVNWENICLYQKLSESFMEEFFKQLDLTAIASHQKISEAFYLKHRDKLDASIIANHQKYSIEFLKEEGLFPLVKESNWLYWTKNDKLDFLKSKQQYEIVNDEYIVAYKFVRDKGYSLFNLQYKYEIGKEYEAHCDCNSDKNNSFGLSAYNKETAEQNISRKNSYNKKHKLIKVHIDIDNIGVILSKQRKIRASKFQVISEESMER